MPRLVRGGKWAYGWVAVGPEGEITIPPAAQREYDFHAGGEVVFLPGSRRSGGFGISTHRLTVALPEQWAGRALGRGRIGDDGQLRVPPEVGAMPGDRLLAVRGSRYALGFVAQGPIYEEALKHHGLEQFGQGNTNRGLGMQTTGQSTTGFVDVHGTKLYYEVAGSGHPLVLVHSGWVDSRMWDEQFDRLSHRFQVIRYDIRGHGQSAVGDVPYSHVDDLDELLTRLGVDTACLLSLSLGGSIVTASAIVHPARMDALILVSTGGVRGIPLTDDEQQRFAAPSLAAQRGERAQAIDLFVQLWVDGISGPAAPHVHERARAMLMDFTFPQLSPDFPEERWPETATLDHIGAIRAPTLIVVGENDQRIFHRAADILQAQFSTAQKVVIEGAAHMVNMDQPAVFDQTVLDFLTHVFRPPDQSEPSHFPW